MDREELHDMTLIWLNVYIVDIVNKLVQLMPLWKDPITKMQQWLTNNFFIIRKNCYQTEIDGSHNLLVTLNPKSETEMIKI